MANRTASAALVVALAGAGVAFAQHEFPCVGTAGSTACTSLIPDAVGATPSVMTSSIPVPAGICTSPAVGRAVVAVDLTHDYVGDLRLRVSNPGGTWVTLLDRPPSSPPLPGGCPHDDILGAFSDDGAPFPCSFTIPAGGGFMAPASPLAAYNGLATAGTWTLEITDYAHGGTGALNDWSVELTCGTPPVVSITTADEYACEQPVQTGAFLVSRASASSSPLEVNLVIGGTASPSRYAPITVPVTIPAFATSVTVLVAPIANAIAEGEQTVDASVAPGAFYTVGSPNLAEVEILDELEAQEAIPALSAAGLALLALLLLAVGIAMLRGRLA